MSEDLPGRLRRRAESILSDGNFAGIEPTAASLKEVVHELYVHQAELEIQNEELRTAQQALEASRIQYLQLFQSVPLACLTVNAAGIVGEANAAAERQFGLPLRRLKGRPLTLLVDSMDHGRLFASLGRLRDSGHWTRQEFSYVGPQGTPIDGLTDARTVVLDDGDKGDILLTITDLTERNVWLREVQHSRDEAERARAAYHHILQAVADGILGTDIEGRIRFANAAAVRMTGLGEGELVGRTLHSLCAGPGAQSNGPEALAQSLRDGQVRSLSGERLLRASGEAFTAEMTVSPIVEYGRTEGAVVAFRDVTARIAAEEALGLSERRHRILVQSLHEGLAMHAADGRVLVANGMAERLLDGPARLLLDPLAKPLGRPANGERSLGDRKASTVGRRLIDANGSRLQGLPPAAEAMSSGKPVIERIVGIAEGEGAAAPVRWLRISSHPVDRLADGAEGRVEAVVSSVTDITAMKVLERELNVALDAKERFMASASHDLRQPVQAMMLLSGLLLKERLDGAARTLAEQLRQSVGSLGTLLDGMLDISKLEAGLVSPELAPVDLHALIGRLKGEFAPVADSAGLRLKTWLPRLTVLTDGALLERVLRNLLSNALRYTRKGGVLCGIRRRAGAVRLEVWDTGIGIAENQIDRIFQDFYQVGNAARDRREGLGMGLSIAKRLVAMLGGTIEVTSQLGRGTCFAVCLPVRKPAAEDDGRTAGDPGETEGDGDGALILLVEDDAVIRMALGLMLEGWGYRVVDAGTVTEAFGHLDDGVEPDLVLADYRLPDGATGLMAMDTVRRRLGRDVPGILLTGDTSSDRLREAASAQCALLHKPIQPHSLQAAVREALKTG